MTQIHVAQPASGAAIGGRRGVCPTLWQPMQTGDGLLARLRPVDGVISPAQLEYVARLAERFGNGQVEITARGNLQVRGLRTDIVPEFAAAVEAVVDIETGLTIETSPLAGLDPTEIADPRPIAASIRLAVAGGALDTMLGPKVTVVVDGGGAMGRDALPADVRLRAVPSSGPEAWSVGIGPHVIGQVRAADAANVALALVGLVADLGPQGRGRDIDPQTARRRSMPMIADTAAQPTAAPQSPARIGLSDGRVGAVIGLAFGAVSASALIELANAARDAGIAEFRLAPHHGLVAICASEAVAVQFQAVAATSGFLTETGDARHTISACIGSDGCASGTLAARRIAEALAQAEPGFFDGSFTLHVSGCAKGCAHPGPALLTLAGNGSDMNLTIDGSARSEPILRLADDAAPGAIQRLAELWRNERALGESVASCFKRLGAAQIAAAARQGQR